MSEVTLEELHELLKHFGKNSYFSGNATPGSLDHKIISKVEALFKLDYSVVTLEDSICSWFRYPEKIFIPEAEHGHQMNNTQTLNPTAMETLTEATAKTTITNTSNGSKAKGNPSTTPNKSNAAKNEDGENVQRNRKEPTSTATPTSTSTQPSSMQSQQQQQQQQVQHTIYETLFDVGKVRELLSNTRYARYARCRCRFVVPVILFRGKFICRSATVARTTEQYMRMMQVAGVNLVALLGGGATESAPSNGNGTVQKDGQENKKNGSNDANNGSDHDPEVDDPVADKHLDTIQKNSTEPPPSFSSDEVIKNDIELLKALNVKTIVDLMVENNKKKYGCYVSSSEKVDEQQRYKEFTLMGMPYPGCEFFKKFRDNNYVSEKLIFDWKQSFIDARINIPENGPATELDINWPDYEKWDLTTLTQNYLKAILKYLQDESAGLLVHCISGWDRTPLFISLIRLSLWADGLIHQSLGPMQMAYLTLAYDWYLFGHLLPDRLNVGEDILVFCFHVLKYLWSDDFRVIVPGSHRRRTKTSSSSGSSIVVLKHSDEDDDSVGDMDDSTNCDSTTFAESIYVSPSQSGRSPNSKRTRSSPMAVPGSNTTATNRERHDSSSSGSWMNVTGTGSLETIKNEGTMSERMMSAASGVGRLQPTNSNGSDSQRRQRLEELRNIVIPAYARMVGLRFNEGTPSFIKSITDKLW